MAFQTTFQTLLASFQSVRVTSHKTARVISFSLSVTTCSPIAFPEQFISAVAAAFSRHEQAVVHCRNASN